MPPRRRFSATLPWGERPSLRRRVLRVVLFALAVIALARLASWVGRVPSEPVRAERVIPVQ